MAAGDTRASSPPSSHSRGHNGSSRFPLLMWHFVQWRCDFITQFCTRDLTAGTETIHHVFVSRDWTERLFHYKKVTLITQEHLAFVNCVDKWYIRPSRQQRPGSICAIGETSQSGWWPDSFNCANAVPDSLPAMLTRWFLPKMLQTKNNSFVAAPKYSKIHLWLKANCF